MAWMSKITYDVITLSGTGCFIAFNSGCQRVMCTQRKNRCKNKIHSQVKMSPFEIAWLNQQLKSPLSWQSTE